MGSGQDHNPLRRGSDRAEAGIVALLIGAFLLGAPLIALITWRMAFAGTVTTTNAIHDGWRQVSVDTPMSPRQAVTHADFAAGIAVLVWALILLNTGMISRHLLDRHRLAAWESDWRTSSLSGPAGASPGR